jgi:hypothetical protein
MTLSSRIVDAGFGVFFVGLAVAVVVFADPLTGSGPWLVAAVLAVLGAQSVWSAIFDRRSWLSRIGPLP